MSRLRLVVVGILLVSAACGDPSTGPERNPGRIASLPEGNPHVVELRGIVEQLDYGRFGLSQPNRLVMLRYDVEALLGALGKEVVLHGRFGSDGEFDVAALRVVEVDDVEATARFPGSNPAGVKQ